MKSKAEFIIIGGGIVGLTLAYQILKRKISSDIVIGMNFFPL